MCFNTHVIIKITLTFFVVVESGIITQKLKEKLFNDCVGLLEYTGWVKIRVAVNT